MKRYKQTDDIDKGAYKQCKKKAKNAVAIAKAEAYEEICPVYTTTFNLG